MRANSLFRFVPVLAKTITALAKAQTDKAATDRAVEIDAELRTLRAAKTRGSVGSVNPLEALLTTIFGALLAAWQKALFAVIYDLVLIALTIGIEATAHTSPAATRSADMRTKRENSDISEPIGTPVEHIEPRDRAEPADIAPPAARPNRAPTSRPRDSAPLIFTNCVPAVSSAGTLRPGNSS